MTIQTIMTADESGKELVEFAKRKGEQLKRANKTQIRNIFSEIRIIETLWEKDQPKGMRRLNMLKPKIEYQIRRNKELEPIKDDLLTAVDFVVNANNTERNKRFERFVELFEAILAYHRAIVG